MKNFLSLILVVTLISLNLQIGNAASCSGVETPVEIQDPGESEVVIYNNCSSCKTNTLTVTVSFSEIDHTALNGEEVELTVTGPGGEVIGEIMSSAPVFSIQVTGTTSGAYTATVSSSLLILTDTELVGN